MMNVGIGIALIGVIAAAPGAILSLLAELGFRKERPFWRWDTILAMCGIVALFGGLAIAGQLHFAAHS